MQRLSPSPTPSPSSLAADERLQDAKATRARKVKNAAPATFAALCLFCGFVATGCSHGYALTLSNSDVIYARTKPRLNDRGDYVFKDGQGQEQQVKAMRVRMIEAQ